MDEIITREEAAALMEAATRGPWRGDRNDGTVKYAILAGDHEAPIVVLSVDHKNGTYGFGCGYGDPDETRYADDPSADERLAIAAPALASTVVALHHRIAELEATLAAERGDPAGALPGWRWDGSSWVRIAENGDRLRVQRVAILGRPVLWSWVIGRQGHGVIAGDANDPDAWIPTAREAMRAADAAATPTNPRVVIVEPATACPNDIAGGGGARVICADPESCVKHGCGYLESLGDGEVKL